jgi:SAM-dependent methyltransferase
MLKIDSETFELIKLQRTGVKDAEGYKKTLVEDFETLASFPRKRILDIGSGIAGVHLLLNSDVCLLDKTQTDKDLYYGFHERTSFYSSLKLAEKFLRENGFNHKIETQEATEDNQINFEGKFDLVISLISWGFHYPVETYLDKVYDKLEVGGNLIIDVRKGTNGLEVLKNKFGEGYIVKDYKKYLRVRCTK